MERYKSFSVKLVKRLLIPYYLAEIFWYPIWLIAVHWLGHAAYVQNPFLTPLDAFIGIFIGNGHLLTLVPLWFLPALFFTEIIFIKLHNRFAIRGKIFAATVVAVSCMGDLVGKKLFLPLGLDIAMTAQVFIFAGVLIRKYNVLERLSLWRCLLAAIVLAAVFFLNGKVDMMIRDYGENLVLFYAGGLAGTLLVMKFSTAAARLGGKFCALIEYCGRQSLFVMIMHMPIAFVIYDATTVILNWNLQDVAFLPEVIITAILLGTLVPLWIAKNFGRKPVLKYLCT